MKRGKPLQRKTPLAAGTKGLSPGDGLKRTEFKRKSSATGSGGLSKARSRPLGPVAQAMRLEWQRMASRGQCAVCGRRASDNQGHHIVPLGDLKTAGVPEELWYRLENQLVLCGPYSNLRCHERHESWTARVPLAVVLAKQPKVLVFADEVGMRTRLEREYR